MQNAYINEYLNRIEAVSQQVQTTFGPMNAAQLNWKPAAEKWSIAQCLHHLITLNKSYFPFFVKLEADTFENNLWEKISPFSGYFGNMLKKSMISPSAKRSMKTPVVWRPSQSELPDTIVADFLTHQNELLNLLRAIGQHNHASITISSPASSLFTYSLKDAVIIIATHEERHLRQAQGVQAMPGFP